MTLDDTIVAISSPPGSAPRGIVRLSGPQATAIAETIFSIDPPGSPKDPHTNQFPISLGCHGHLARAATGGTPVPPLDVPPQDAPPQDVAPKNVPPQDNHPVCSCAGPEPRPLHKIRQNARLEGTVQVGSARLPAAAHVFRTPHSYTRQDVVELHLLGAPGVLALVVEACLAAGARRAEPGEFTARAFLAGAFDLSQVHGIAGMIAARSDYQLQAAQRLLHGTLSQTAVRAREELADLLSRVEGALDFADEPIEFITPQRLRERLCGVRGALQTTAEAGLRAERWIRLPRVVLVGPTNAGKSALMNRLTGLDRAICAPMAGTTRDVLSAPLVLDSMDCLLIDVAGLDQAETELDAKVQAAARRAVQDADLILLVLDVSDVAHLEALSSFAEDGGLAGHTLPQGTPTVIALNKCDLVPHRRQHDVVAGVTASTDVPVCPVSAAGGTGCQALRKELERLLHDRPVDVNDASIALMAEHRAALGQAIEAVERAVQLAADDLHNADLVAAELHAAADHLGTLVGKDEPEELLGRIFSRFCIGK